MPPKSTSTTGKRRSSSSTAAISNPSTKPSLTRSFSSSKSSFTNLSATGKKSSTVAQAKTVPAVQENQDDDDEAKDLNRAYPRLLKQAKKEMGTPIHAEDWDNLQIILRVFDSSPEYGPCSNQPRLERYERAVALGLEPPKEIGEILRSKVGRKRPEIAQSAFNI